MVLRTNLFSAAVASLLLFSLARCAIAADVARGEVSPF